MTVLVTQSRKGAPRLVIGHNGRTALIDTLRANEVPSNALIHFKNSWDGCPVQWVKSTREALLLIGIIDVENEK